MLIVYGTPASLNDIQFCLRMKNGVSSSRAVSLFQAQRRAINIRPFLVIYIRNYNEIKSKQNNCDIRQKNRLQLRLDGRSRADGCRGLLPPSSLYLSLYELCNAASSPTINFILPHVLFICANSFSVLDRPHFNRHFYYFSLSSRRHFN